MSYSVGFVIASYTSLEIKESFVLSNLEKILEFYSNVLIVVVDNNSPNKIIYDKIKTKYKNRSNVVVLHNQTNYKYELGAYRYAVLRGYRANVMFFLQDTMVINKKYKGIDLIPKNSGQPIFYRDKFPTEYTSQQSVEWINLQLKRMGLVTSNQDFFNKSPIVIGVNLMITSNLVERLLLLGFFDTHVDSKTFSCSSERLVGQILFQLGYARNSICGSDWSPEALAQSTCFVKIRQKKDFDQVERLREDQIKFFSFKNNDDLTVSTSEIKPRSQNYL